MNKKLFCAFVLFAFLCMESCVEESSQEYLPQKDFIDALEDLSEQFDVPLSYDPDNICSKSSLLEEVSFGLEAINNLEKHQYEIVVSSSNELSLVYSPLQSPLLHSVSEVSSVAIGEPYWCCQFTLSWANGIDVYYSVSTEFWEKYGDNVTCAYINEGRVYLDTQFNLKWAGIDYGRYCLCGYYDLYTHIDTFTFTRVS